MNNGYDHQSRTLHKARTLSKQILGNDMDMINRYASKYGPNRPKRSQTVQNTYNQSYGGYNQYNSAFGSMANGGSYSSHGYNSSSNSSTSTNSNHQSYGKRSRRTPSNLINAHTLNQWDQSSVNSQQSDMSEAMSMMVNSYQSKLEKEADFLDEMEEEAMQNEKFANVQRAEEWSVKEVCYWLNRIHLDKYMKAFRDQIIDGSILLRDLDQMMLENELGVKRLHVKKILREINKLKNQSLKFKKQSNDTRDELIQTLRNEIDELKAKNKSLMNQLKNANNGRKSYNFNGLK